MTTVSRSIVIIVFDLFSLSCDFFLLCFTNKAVNSSWSCYACWNKQLYNRKLSSITETFWIQFRKLTSFKTLCIHYISLYKKEYFFEKILMSSLFDNDYVNLILPFNSSITLFLTIKRTFSNWMFHEQLCF